MDQKWITSWRISSLLEYLEWEFCRYWDRSNPILHERAQWEICGQRAEGGKLFYGQKFHPSQYACPFAGPFIRDGFYFPIPFNLDLTCDTLTNEWNVSEVVRCELWNLCLKRALKLLFSFCWKPETSRQGSQSSQRPTPTTKCASVAILDLLAHMTVRWVSELKWKQQRTCLAHRIVKTSCEVHRIVKIIFCLPS